MSFQVSSVMGVKSVICRSNDRSLVGQVVGQTVVHSVQESGEEIKKNSRGVLCKNYL